MAPDGSSSPAVDNPVVATEDGEIRLEYWGEDLNNDREAPSLAQLIKSVSFADEFDPTVCTSDGQWAYVPGGRETSAETTIILMGSLCDSTSDLVGVPVTDDHLHSVPSEVASKSCLVVSLSSRTPGHDSSSRSR